MRRTNEDYRVAERKALSRACGALGMVAAYLALALVVCVMCAQPTDMPAPELLPIPDDRPLVSDYHKQLAQLDGYAVYQWNDVWYVDPNLPPVYWKE